MNAYSDINRKGEVKIQKQIMKSVTKEQKRKTEENRIKEKSKGKRMREID